MDDSISRAAVLEIIREYCPDEPISKDLREYWKKRFEPLIKVREEVEKIPLADGWIPCSERLPEDGRVVLWCNEHGSVFTTAITARFCNSWAVGKRHRSSRMVAWCPLPEPYKEGEQP